MFYCYPSGINIAAKRLITYWGKGPSDIVPQTNFLRNTVFTRLGSEDIMLQCQNIFTKINSHHFLIILQVEELL